MITMIIACAGDAHRAKDQMAKLIVALPKIDVFCFLGDLDVDAAHLKGVIAKEQPGASFHAVAGNNDLCSDLPRTLILQFGKTRALLTHGHLFYVKLSPMALMLEAGKQGCKLALFGHTHQPYVKLSNGVQLINPGALMKGQWALIDTDKENVVSLRVL